MFVKNEKKNGNPNAGSEEIQQNIGMEFGIEKCVMLVMKSEKGQMTEGIELPNQYKIITLEEKILTHTWEYWKWTSPNKWK